jgi:15-cis-phytoene synthase/lycopene beta-cyclase
MADDLIDDATTQQEMKTWVSKLYRYLDFFYKRDLQTGKTSRRAHVDEFKLNAFIDCEFPPSAKSALKLLPTDILPGNPLYLLIDGFKMDAQFKTEKNQDRFPIKAEQDLINYSLCVAGTIGELCVSLIVHQCGSACTPSQLDAMLDASRQMGVALQYVNIARDIQVDAKLGRVYLPVSWLKEVYLTPEMIIRDPLCKETFVFRERLLDEAFRLWNYARPLMNGLPDGGRGPMVVAVENYMEIGRVLRTNRGQVRTVGKATVPVSRRLWVSIKALMSA